MILNKKYDESLYYMITSNTDCSQDVLNMIKSIPEEYLSSIQDFINDNDYEKVYGLIFNLSSNKIFIYRKINNNSISLTICTSFDDNKIVYQETLILKIPKSFDMLSACEQNDIGSYRMSCGEEILKEQEYIFTKATKNQYLIFSKEPNELYGKQTKLSFVDAIQNQEINIVDLHPKQRLRR